MYLKCNSKKNGSWDKKEICSPKKTKTCFEETVPCCCDSNQIDARDIIYKKEAKECFSSLDSLGITNGTDLEYIIDKFGKMLENFNYFDVKNNIFGAEDFEDFLISLQKDLKNKNEVIKILQENLVEQKEVITELTERVQALEKPALIDTKGLGFTLDSSLKDILQKIINNG